MQLDLFDRTPDNVPPRLDQFDWVLINSSAGKDSTACLVRTMQEVDRQGFDRSRVVVVHADLGRFEWAGVPELAREHAAAYGLRFEVVAKPGADLLQRVRERGKWPGPGPARWCTSDFKRGPIRKLMTRLANELHENERDSQANPSALGRPVQILNVMGLRAEESADRAKLEAYTFNERASNKTRRQVCDWLPVHSWSESEVWQAIRESGLRHHAAYDLGMPRLSCAFCIFANRDALLIAGEHNPELLAEYVETEKATGHTFKHGLPIVEIQDALARGERGNVNRCRANCWAA